MAEGNRWLPAQSLTPADRAAVVAAVEEDARWNLRYAFMVVLSAGIAVLGLLQSSPAVVIGAMLISPLMGPIIGLGFALAVFDWRNVRRALVALAAGSILAVGVSALVVILSPLQTVTPEILARTRPNLFDLLIAIFSALAGTYATIRGKGATIVGVAIATALMPPLATAGFGLASANGAIASGALALFFTNLLAIALTAAVMARIFGFGSSLSADQTQRQAALIIIVFIAMAVPLGLSLSRIAWESVATRNLRTEVAAAFVDDGHVSQISIDFVGKPIKANAIVLTKAFNRQAETAATDAARRILGTDVQFTMEQIIVNQDTSPLEREQAVVAMAMAMVESGARDTNRGTAIAEALAALAGVTPDDVVVDVSRRRALTQAIGSNSLAAYAEGEARIADRNPGWTIELMPPTALPVNIRFAPGGDGPESAVAGDIETALWALQRRAVRAVRVIGHAASSEDGTGSRSALADARAQAIAARLREAGIAATAEIDPVGPRQRAAERLNGAAMMRRVDLLPVPTADAAGR
jgi:uncharacterized hydrophobic protein (TIGR00271 family)